MKTIGIIPARYASTRFPGKPLVEIKGKPMIQHVYEQASKALDYVYVATDDSRIENVVKKFNGKVVLTSENHQSGTDRCAEAISIIEKSLKIKFDVVLCIQGDEPFIQPEQLKLLSDAFKIDNVQIATLIKPTNSEEEINNPNIVKVIIDKNKDAIYFSRNPIPYLRNKDSKCQTLYFKHIGIYAYRTNILAEITKLPQGMLEIAESLEQLRWIENGYKIYIQITEFETIAIDSPEDLKKII
ncbi:MAG: 3-deoxy-manno-octulosonate cytidylyltransferase [Bacteroidetes bacterium GWA2_30_7]|nr:MAG: 3-deoxy-manno-octulosonate cytidylyltransferase [Bacteroidetes bacterium GWA2_30_7]